MNENPIPETETPDAQLEAYTETLGIVRSLAEHRIKFTPHRRLIAREKIEPAKFASGADLESFDKIELVNFMTGKKCIAHVSGGTESYILEWEGGWRSRATHRDLELDYVRA